MPLRRHYRIWTSLIVTALALTSITLKASATSAISETPHRMLSTEAAVAVIDTIVVNNQQQPTAGPGDVSLIRAGSSTPGGVDVGTQLAKGDELITGAQDQVTLRFLDGTGDSPNLVYLDENTSVKISSACLKSGRILAWVGINFKFCVGNTTLGVEGTEFVVSAVPNEPPKVAVLKGKVFLETTETAQLPAAPTIAATATSPTAPAVASSKPGARLEIKAKEEATITPESVTKVEIPEMTGRTIIDYWSARMIKADQKAGPKANLNYKNEQDRNQRFIEARFKAVWDNDPTSLETVAKVYNDWNNGDKAAKTLKTAASIQPQIAAKTEYQIDLAEAERLQGQYTKAESRVDAVLQKEPNNNTASYLKGKIALDSFAKTERVSDLTEARSFFSQALADRPDAKLDSALVERELMYALRENANRSATTATDLLCPEAPVEGINYSVIVDLPALEPGKPRISGPATMYIVGNQFMLKTRAGTLAGGIAAATTSGYNAVALRFDDALRGQYENGVTISLRARGTCQRLRLEGTGTAGYIRITPTKGSGD